MILTITAIISLNPISQFVFLMETLFTVKWELRFRRLQDSLHAIFTTTVSYLIALKKAACVTDTLLCESGPVLEIT